MRDHRRSFQIEELEARDVPAMLGVNIDTWQAVCVSTPDHTHVTIIRQIVEQGKVTMQDLHLVATSLSQTVSDQLFRDPTTHSVMKQMNDLMQI